MLPLYLREADAVANFTTRERPQMKHTWKIRLAERRDVGELLAIEEAQFPEPWTRRILLDEIENTETRRYTVATEKSESSAIWASCSCSKNFTSTRSGPSPTRGPGHRDVVVG